MQSRTQRSDTETAITDSDLELPRDVRTVRAKLVYLYLRATRRAEIAEISRAIKEPQIRLYPALEYLVDLGLVTRNGSTFAIAAS